MLSKVHLLPIGLLSAFITKLLIFGTNPSEMGVVFSLSAIVAGYEYLSKSRRIQKVETDNQEFQASINRQFEEHKAIIAKQNEVIKSMATELDTARNNITAIKMSSGLKKVGS